MSATAMGEKIKRLAEWDITEIFGADNLFQPESVIRRTMQKYERLYETRRSYLLINGSSAGDYSFHPGLRAARRTSDHGPQLSQIGF